MSTGFAETLKTIRLERKLSQQQLAGKLFVDRSSIAHWENGSRVPNAHMINRISKALNVDVGTLLNAITGEENDPPHIIVIDDEQVILNGEISALTKMLPGINIKGFTSPDEALAFASENKVGIAFTDIELGSMSGIDFCKKLLAISPYTNVIFLTAFPDYSIDAWSTGASGFMVKPLTTDNVKKQFSLLRYPVSGVKLNVLSDADN